MKFKSFFLFFIILFSFKKSLSAQFIKSIFSKAETWEFAKDQESLIKKNIRQDVQFLSSLQLEGRESGTLGAQNAALYIKDRLNKMNVVSLNLPAMFKVSTSRRLTANTKLT